MTRYKIDYGWSFAHLWADVKTPAEALELFGALAGQCFGLRKCITKEPEIVGESSDNLPEWAPAGSAYALTHNPPIEDRIAWWDAEHKSLTEHGDFLPRHRTPEGELLLYRATPDGSYHALGSYGRAECSVTLRLRFDLVLPLRTARLWEPCGRPGCRNVWKPEMLGKLAGGGA